jgi:hypothetical protein
MSNRSEPPQQQPILAGGGMPTERSTTGTRPVLPAAPQEWIFESEAD